MCGRYATTRNSAALTALFEAIDETQDDLAPNYNVAPTNRVPIVRFAAAAGVRTLSVARWGLVPAWASDFKIGARMINARAETVATSRAYASAFARRRCLVPADGWYEWVRSADGVLPGQPGRVATVGQATDCPAPRADVRAGRRGAVRQPYFMTAADGSPLVFAGLWELSGPLGHQRLTCTILTSDAVGALADVHPRMPLLLPPRRWSEWLGAPPAESLLRPTPDELVADLEIRPVSKAVGDVRNAGPRLIDRVVPEVVGGASAVTETLRLF